MHKKRIMIYPSAYEAGCDEAGRGALAGPVVAAAVCLPKKGLDFSASLRDSKQLSAKARQLFSTKLKRVAQWAIGMANEEEIAKYNVLWASVLAMHRALRRLSSCYEFRRIMVDGLHFKRFSDLPHRCVVGADRRYLHVASASILAKTYRDAWMVSLHRQWDKYHWHTNKGYPTALHRACLRRYGICPHHRKGFRLHADTD